LSPAFTPAKTTTPRPDQQKLRHRGRGRSGGPSTFLSALSGGQIQRILLARAILNDPQILVLDEATQGPDQPASAVFYRLIETLRDNVGCAVLMVSHELHVIISATDWVICLNGHFCCEGTPDVVTATAACRDLFGTGTGGALALYRHDHEHDHPHEAAN
jgi:zinc transport system ATP-binding protein